MSKKIEDTMNGRNNINILSSAFESFFASLYLDQGIKSTFKFLINVITKELDIEEMATTENNYKDLIIQFYKKNNLGTPNYKVQSITGPDHAKVFTMILINPYNGSILASASGSSKKFGERKVAEIGYHILNNI